ncbi:MAG: SDR family oxidoreductase [Pseudomonadota bacterium]
MDKRIIITGGTRGIGRAIVKELSADYRVTAVWHSTEPEGLPENVATVRADLRSETGCQDILAQLSDGPVHGLVNNAGYFAASEISGFDAQDVLAMMHVNAVAPAQLLAALLPRMDAGSRVVNISSVNADLPPMGAALYGASKAALNAWTQGAAKELGPRGITVNAVAPGAVNIPEAPRSPDLTAKFEELTALGQLASTKDIANTVRFLLSDAASHITGEVIRVSGGYRL